LGKSQTKELIQTRKSAQFVIAAIALDALVELVTRRKRLRSQGSFPSQEETPKLFCLELKNGHGNSVHSAGL